MIVIISDVEGTRTVHGDTARIGKPGRSPGAIGRAITRSARQCRHHAATRDLPDRVIIAVRNINVVRTIHSDATGIRKPGGRSGTVGRPDIKRAASQCCHHPTAGYHSNRVIVGIRDKDVARSIHRQTRRMPKPCSCSGSVNVSSLGESQARECGYHPAARDLSDRIVVGVGDVNIVRTVNRHTAWRRKPRGTPGCIRCSGNSRRARVGRDHPCAGNQSNGMIRTVCNVEVTPAVHRHTRGRVKPGIAPGIVRRTGIARQAGQGRHFHGGNDNFSNRVVSGIGHVENIRAAQRQTRR